MGIGIRELRDHPWAGNPVKRLAVPILAASVAACANQGGSVRLGSDVPRGAKLTAGREITASACNYWWWPFSMSVDRLETAHQALLDQAGGDLIVDVAVQGTWYDLGVGTLECTELRARAVRIAPPRIAATPAPASAAGLIAGGRARLRGDAGLRTQPRLDSATVSGVDAGIALTLKAAMQKDRGTWWYVTTPAASGWVRDVDLEPVAP